MIGPCQGLLGQPQLIDPAGFYPGSWAASWSGLRSPPFMCATWQVIVMCDGQGDAVDLEGDVGTVGERPSASLSSSVLQSIKSSQRLDPSGRAFFL